MKKLTVDSAVRDIPQFIFVGSNTSTPCTFCLTSGKKASIQFRPVFLKQTSFNGARLSSAAGVRITASPPPQQHWKDPVHKPLTWQLCFVSFRGGGAFSAGGKFTRTDGPRVLECMHCTGWPMLEDGRKESLTVRHKVILIERRMVSTILSSLQTENLR